jgi:hypothetical protein
LSHDASIPVCRWRHALIAGHTRVDRKIAAWRKGTRFAGDPSTMSMPGFNDMPVLPPQTAWWVVLANVAVIAALVAAVIT